MKRIIITALSILFVFCIISCNPLTLGKKGGYGSITINLPSSFHRAVSFSQTEEHITYNAAVKQGNSVIDEKSGESGDALTFNQVTPGSYTVEVIAYDGSDLIGHGSNTAVVTAGEDTSLPITMNHYLAVLNDDGSSQGLAVNDLALYDYDTTNPQTTFTPKFTSTSIPADKMLDYWVDDTGNHYADGKPITLDGKTLPLQLKAVYKDVPADFVCIPAASFYINGNLVENEAPVTLSTYLICDHEVTQKEYADAGCTYLDEDNKPKKAYGLGDNYPVYWVNWYNAIVYCNRRSINEELEPCYELFESTDPDDWGEIPSDDIGDSFWNEVIWNKNANGYRLPTFAEWIYAARAGTVFYGKQYSGTTLYNRLETYCWFHDSYKNGNPIPSEVKTKQPNNFGLYDMTGNVAELCWDISESIPNYYLGPLYTEPVTDPCGPSFEDIPEDQAVFRISMSNGPTDFDPIIKYNGSTGYTTSYSLGFRVARNASGPANPPHVTRPTTTPDTSDFTTVDASSAQGIGRKLLVCDHKVTQGEFYDFFYKTYNNSTQSENSEDPIHTVTWAEAVCYCNLRSMVEGLTPCYTKPTENNYTTDPDTWGSYPAFAEDEYWNWVVMTCDFTANGYRLPTIAEWRYFSDGYNLNDIEGDFTEWGWDPSGEDNDMRPAINVSNLNSDCSVSILNCENSYCFRVVRTLTE